MRTWQLQDAKAHFSELVKAAHDKPQGITVRGKEEVVVLAVKEYERLAGKPKSLLEILRDPSIIGANLEIDRNESPSRPVDLKP